MLTVPPHKIYPRITIPWFAKRPCQIQQYQPRLQNLLQRRHETFTSITPPATQSSLTSSPGSTPLGSSTPSSPPTHDISPWKHYIAPTLFAFVTMGGSFVVAASSYERQETLLFRRTQQRRELLRRKLRNDHIDEDAFAAFEWRQHHDERKRHQPNDDDDDEKKRHHLQQIKKQQQERQDPGKRGGLDLTLGMIQSWARYQWYQCQVFYQDSSRRTINCLIGFNLLVFAGWRLLPLKFQPFMTRWFTNHPVWCVGPRNLNLVTASFSHQHFVPLAINMTALWYFGSTLHDILGEQQFLAFYLSSAVAATTVSRWLSLLTRHYRPLMLLPSVISTGASGAVYGCLAALTVLHPTSIVDLIPWTPIPLSVVLPGLLTLDLTGILMRWRLFDPYSHIGGAGFGAWYMTIGQEKMWIPLVRKIRDIRDRNERNGRNGPPTTSIDLQSPQWPWVRQINKEG